MQRFIYPSALLLVIFAPYLAHAATSDALSAGFQIIPLACNCAKGSAAGLALSNSAPAWGCILATFQNVISFVVALSTLIIVIFITLAGFTYMTAGGNPEQRSLANKRILNAVIGLVIVLCAYLLIDSLMKVVYDSSTAKFGPWNSILGSSDVAQDCLAIHNPPSSLPALNGANNGSGGNGNAASTPNATPATYGGICKAPSDPNNPCSVQSLSNTCFANQAASASAVCMVESSNGQQSIKSGSDLLNNGQGPSYSIGLWQLNLTTTQVGGLNCPAAFTAPCQGTALKGEAKIGWCHSSIKSDSASQALYTSCVAAAEVGSTNSQAACALYARHQTFSDWSCSASRCSVPGAKSFSTGPCAPQSH